MILEARSLTKVYENDVVALDNVSFYVDDDRIVIVGPNGCGKTTLLSIVAGLRRPTRGVLTINGFEPYIERERVLKEVSFGFAKPKLLFTSRVRDLVKLVAECRGCGEEVWNYVYELGIEPFLDSRTCDLSAGQIQLLMVFLTTACWDGIVLLDEPLANLDMVNVRRVVNFLTKRRNFIVSTHSVDEAELLSSSVIALNQGKLAWCGKINELKFDNLYEVYLDSDEVLKQLDAEVLYQSGRLAIVRCRESVLRDALDRGSINGFRRCGLRCVLLGLTT